MADIKGTHPSPAASPSAKVAMVAQFYPGELRWGDLRAMLALASQPDDSLVDFEFGDPNDSTRITGVYVDIAWPR